jgi:hypothetical protein
MALGILLAVLVNAANIRTVAVQYPGQFSVGDVLMKDSRDLAAMPNTLYGETLRQPIISSAWGSVVETAALVVVVRNWELYLGLILIATILSIAARDRNPRITVRPTGEHTDHWPRWIHGRPA